MESRRCFRCGIGRRLNWRRRCWQVGLEAFLATVDLKKLPAQFAGRKFDAQLLADLPEGVDPCGENGEFHTCVVAGPMFAHRLAVTTGERVERDGYAYCDLVIS